MHLIRLLFVSVVLLCCAVCRHGGPLPAASAPPLVAGKPAAQSACLSAAISWPGGDILRAPVKTLFIAGRQRDVDEIICVVNGGYEREPYWFRVDRLSRKLTDIRVSSRIVAGLLASPDGKYLAVEQLSEALSDIEIVELPALLRAGAYRKVAEVGAFPGSVSIKGWNEGRLEVTGGTLLSYSPAANSRLDLFSDETFAVDVATKKVFPLSDELQDPARYYCARVSMPDLDNRWIAVDALRRLGDKSAIGCLEEALAREPDETLREYMRDAGDELRDPVQHLCARFSAQDSRTRMDAAMSMRILRVTSAVSCLRDALAREVDPGVRQFMRSTLDTLLKR